MVIYEQVAAVGGSKTMGACFESLHRKWWFLVLYYSTIILLQLRLIIRWISTKKLIVKRWMEFIA